jgi:hypothetical protein
LNLTFALPEHFAQALTAGVGCLPWTSVGLTVRTLWMITTNNLEQKYSLTFCVVQRLPVVITSWYFCASSCYHTLSCFWLLFCCCHVWLFPSPPVLESCKYCKVKRYQSTHTLHLAIEHNWIQQRM